MPVLGLFLLPSMVASAPAKPPGNDGYFRALLKVGDAINTVTAIEERRSEDRAKGGGVKEIRTTTSIAYDRFLGKARYELIGPLPSPPVRGGSSVPPLGGRREAKVKRIHIIRVPGPEPSFVFGLPKRIKDAKISSVVVKGGTLLEIRWPRRTRKGPSQDLLLNGDGLPVRIRAYGSTGKVQDEALIEWQNMNGFKLPVRTKLTRYSRLNTLITTSELNSVSLNQPVAATLFSQP
jgi:hypothetical protein